MSLFIDTRGKSTVAVALCDRCHRKFAYDDLQADPNSPGLRVCKDDLDQKDPYRLPPRKTEKTTLRYPRPETVMIISSVLQQETGFYILCENSSKILVR